LYYIDSGKIKKLNTGLEFSGIVSWSDDGKKLLVSGRKYKNSEAELRLLNIKKNPPVILKIIKLNKKTTGSDYDWYVGDK
jgi:hypothetical protein